MDKSTPLSERPQTAPTPADSALPVWLSRLPPEARPYVTLARLDRPVGVWLLLLPCWIGLAFARIPEGFRWIDLLWIPAFALGAAAMRGAGCTWNDISDRKIDAGVARTANRPLPSGAVTLTEAWLFMGCQLLIGFMVWLILPGDAKIAAVLALPLVAIYPFMKRLTWWPQAWLGLTFNWGVLVAAATTDMISAGAVLLYLGLALWTVAYDTIYALQDKEDDALIGVKSTARLFGARAGLAAFAFHMGAAALVGLAAWTMGAQRIGALAALGFLVHGVWQARTLARSKQRNALAIFKSNVWAGAILVAGMTVAAVLSAGPAPDPVEDTALEAAAE